MAAIRIPRSTAFDRTSQILSLCFLLHPPLLRNGHANAGYCYEYPDGITTSERCSPRQDIAHRAANTDVQLPRTASPRRNLWWHMNWTDTSLRIHSRLSRIGESQSHALGLQKKRWRGSRCCSSIGMLSRTKDRNMRITSSCWRFQSLYWQLLQRASGWRSTWKSNGKRDNSPKYWYI